MNTHRCGDGFGDIEGGSSCPIKENEDDLRRHEAESVAFHWLAGARPSVGDPRRAVINQLRIGSLPLVMIEIPNFLPPAVPWDRNFRRQAGVSAWATGDWK